jgi:hypothetical protein
MSDKIPGPIEAPVCLRFYEDRTVPTAKFPDDLPDKIKDYVFAPLNGIGSNAQLMSHITNDGISNKMQLDFKLSREDGMEFSEAPTGSPLFEVNKGTKGMGIFSKVKFYPSYVSLVYGNNASCCNGHFTHPCKIQSHEAVKTRACCYILKNACVYIHTHTLKNS